MKTEYIEALRWLFGKEWSIDWSEAFGLLLTHRAMLEGDHLEALNERDNAYICWLIDLKLLEREDVVQVEASSFRSGTWYFIYTRTEKIESDDEDDPVHDPLTARIEAIAKLKEAQ